MKTCVLTTAALCMPGGPAHAQNYPTKAVRIIVPFAPGGGSDFIAREVAEWAGVVKAARVTAN